MINPKKFCNILNEHDISFFSGVPDSLLKGFCNYIHNNIDSKNHIISANEGGAIALGAGYHMGSGKIPLIYMQNSGFGNAINPLLSLVDKKVYSIPMLILLGWRGSPDIIDEPQHKKQGEITLSLLKTLGIKYSIIYSGTSNVTELIKKSTNYIKKNKCPYVIVVKKNTFEACELKEPSKQNFDLNREEALKVIMNIIDENSIIISTTGKLSRELFEYRSQNNESHNNDFLTVGSMGHANQIALGISIFNTDKNVICLDGDGSAIMHLGSLGIIGDIKPKNFLHIILNNGAHDSVGGQPTIGLDIDFISLAKSMNYNHAFSAKAKTELIQNLNSAKTLNGPTLLEVKINKGSRANLSRPNLSPKVNKTNLMKRLNNDSKN